MKRALTLLLLAAPAQTLPAQSFRFRSVTTGRYVQLRPLVYDSSSDSFVAGDREYAAPVTEDVEVTRGDRAVRETPGTRV